MSEPQSESLKDLSLRWTRAMWEKNLWTHNKWLGFTIWQWPTDLLILQEIIHENKPDIIIETGTNTAGSAVFFASMLDLIGGKKVISIDIAPVQPDILKKVDNHKVGKYINFVTGDSKSPDILDQVETLVDSSKKVMVFLDSDHGYEHVKGEIEAYKKFVPVGGHLIVADTICYELSKIPGWEQFREDNPLRATHEFLKKDTDFICEEQWEKFMVTFFPGGFLKRIK